MKDDSSKDTLYLVDGYAVLYRSYFAFINRPLRSPDGRNTSAVFGFFRSLLALIRDRKPHSLAVTLDSRTPTFRHEKYPEYKATRDKSPDDLHPQVDVVIEILAAMGIPTVRRDGYEADDLLATLSRRCREEGRSCAVITGDKDLLQLVTPEVTVLRPDKGGLREIGPQGVVEEWGVPADQIRDLLALMGDKSDNIPGVAGIGKKTAVTLLQKFGSLDGIYENLEEISSASQKKKLTEQRETAYLSQDLVSLCYDVPLDVKSEDFLMEGWNPAAAVPFFEREGIRSLADEVNGLAGGGTVSAQAAEKQERGTYDCVTTREALDQWAETLRRAGQISLDVETDSLDALAARPVGLCVAAEEGRAAYIPLKASAPEDEGKSLLSEEEVRRVLQGVLDEPGMAVIGQNFKYDWKVLRRWGLRVPGLAFDTMVAAWMDDASTGAYGMDDLAEALLGYHTIHYKDLVEKGQTFDQVPLEKAAEYAAEDADITLRLCRVLRDRLEAKGLLTRLREVEMPLTGLLTEMELRGISLEGEALDRYSVELGGELQELEQEIYDLCGHEFNIKSTKQLQQVLFEERRLKPVKKTKTGYSTNEQVLQQLAAEDPVPEKILQHRGKAKLKSTYVDTLPQMVNPATGRLHTRYIQTGTATGRLSSRDPNLQNIPIKDEAGRRIRNAFTAPEGWVFVSADYSQIELVVLAHLSGDPRLLEAFREGVDVHRKTAGLLFGLEPEAVTPAQRRIAKSINFGVMYGMSPYRLSQEMKIPVSEADRFIKHYFAEYSRIHHFIESTVAEAEEKGYVTTLGGHRRPLPRINSRNRVEKQAAERVAVNTPIQGSAADIMKLAMLRVRRAIKEKGLEARVLLQVHDELILEVPEDEREAAETLLKTEMEGAFELSLPLRVSVESGHRWGDLH